MCLECISIEKDISVDVYGYTLGYKTTISTCWLPAQELSRLMSCHTHAVYTFRFIALKCAFASIFIC